MELFAIKCYVSPKYNILSDCLNLWEKAYSGSWGGEVSRWMGFISLAVSKSSPEELPRKPVQGKDLLASCRDSLG